MRGGHGIAFVADVHGGGARQQLQRVVPGDSLGPQVLDVSRPYAPNVHATITCIILGAHVECH